MEAVIKKMPRDPAARTAKRPSQEEVEAAVRVLLAWAGDNPDREGLLDTPRRVAKAFREYFSGYDEDPAEALSRVPALTETETKTFVAVDGQAYSLAQKCGI